MMVDTLENPTPVASTQTLVTRSLRKRPRVRSARDVAIWFAVAWLVVLALAAVSAPLLPIPRYDEIVGIPYEPLFSSDGILGTDSIGRSILSRALYGARASFTVGFVAAAIGVVVGGLLGLVAGHFRGFVEAVVDVLAEVVQAFPPMLFLVALAAAIRPTLMTLTVSMAVLMIPAFARMTKGAVVAQSTREFVTAARGMGAGHLRIMFREVLPNTVMSLVSFTIISVALLIVIEGSVSFLGYGIPAPSPSWGGMIAEAQSQLRQHPSAALVPIVLLFLTVFSLNSVGDWLRDRFDVGQSQL
ncbi:ABC transporter permease [Microbacterium elymi]|uniref:ABC transporter permease n=1 Tax=Microbacterium elymi TaxID=2909587 RepID=A0ABY5NHV8_9MICO|nr:ABC transporter permease [Microbacterium elymi]UUT34694.1 ABC transporter permease [Microbacterium elymi]